MGVYVDRLRDWGWKLGPSCHLITDGPNEELHAFAASIGLRRGWFQPSASGPHYDLTAGKRAAAVKAGAIELDDRQFHAILKRWREDEKARILRLARVGSADMERAFVAALVDDPQDGATINAFADWLRDQNRERDAANLQAAWREKVLEAVDEVVEAEEHLGGEYERSLGDYPKPHLLERARERHNAAWAELRRRLGVTDDRG